jgi:hypothetical protein
MSKAVANLSNVVSLSGFSKYTRRLVEIKGLSLSATFNHSTKFSDGGN